MKRLLTTVFVFLVSFLGASAQAACSAIGCDDEKIKLLFPNINGKIYVQSHGDMSQLNCTLDNGIYMVLDSTDANAEAIYSMLLTLQTAGKPISRIRIIEGSSNCKIGYVYQETPS